jgi:hypothetical protein
MKAASIPNMKISKTKMKPISARKQLKTKKKFDDTTQNFTASDYVRTQRMLHQRKKKAPSVEYMASVRKDAITRGCRPTSLFAWRDWQESDTSDNESDTTRSTKEASVVQESTITQRAATPELWAKYKADMEANTKAWKKLASTLSGRRGWFEGVLAERRILHDAIWIMRADDYRYGATESSIDSDLLIQILSSRGRGLARSSISTKFLHII